MFGEDQIGQQLAAVRATYAQRPDSPGGQTEPIMTEAFDGRIKITLGVDGRFERIKMSLSALKDGPEALVDELKSGLNEALDQRRELTTVAGPAPDTEAMNEQVAQIQDSSLKQFQAMSDSIGALMSKLPSSR